MGSLVNVEQDGAVAVVRLANPPVNAVNSSLVADLAEALAALDADAGVGAAVLAGDGRGFCAGGDTNAMGSTDPVAKRQQLVRDTRVVQQIVGMGTPVLAAVHGFAVGAGLSLALSCDFAVVETGTRIRVGFRDLALPPDYGGHHFLVQGLGVWRAKHLIWSGGGLTAEEGVALGLFHRAVPEGRALEVAVEEAAALAAGPRQAIAYTKAVLAAAHAEQLRMVLDAEAWASGAVRSTADHQEAVAARRERRDPVFGRDRPLA
jgi:2-(1,2-epoxy-1,2-dihydrophenyl)acetyl-CoA isomerase